MENNQLCWSALSMKCHLTTYTNVVIDVKLVQAVKQVNESSNLTSVVLELLLFCFSRALMHLSTRLILVKFDTSVFGSLLCQF